MSKPKYQRLPATPLFGPLAKTETGQDLEVNSVWSQRLLNLLDTPLANMDLSKITDFQELQEEYNIEGMTLGDILHLQQIKIAAKGGMTSTKAYLAIQKAIGSVEAAKKETDILDPLKKMIDIMHFSLKKARQEEAIDADFVVTSDEDDMASMFDEPEVQHANIIEIELQDNEDDDSSEDNE